jgi:integrase
MLLVLGVPQRAVMDVMGWSESSMAARYQHITTELTSAIADQVGGPYWGAENASDGGEGGRPDTDAGEAI